MYKLAHSNFPRAHEHKTNSASHWVKLYNIPTGCPSFFFLQNRYRYKNKVFSEHIAGYASLANYGTN